MEKGIYDTGEIPRNIWTFPNGTMRNTDHAKLTHNGNWEWFDGFIMSQDGDIIYDPFYNITLNQIKQNKGFLSIGILSIFLLNIITGLIIYYHREILEILISLVST